MIPKFIDKQGLLRDLWFRLRSKLPHKPGVYQFKDMNGKIIYVGKAIDLYHRVASYFSKNHTDLKTNVLVENVKGVETIVVESEIEALILEANLIKKYKPKFNIKLTDDKDFLYIIVTKEEYPKIITGRIKDIKGNKKYFGPFPSSKIVKETLKSLRKVFPWCSNPPKMNSQSGIVGSNSIRDWKLKPCFLDNGVIAKAGLRPCFYYHLGLCPGICAGVISKTEYNKIIERFCKFLDGGKKLVLDELISEMNKASSSQQFEVAGNIKKTIEGIVYLTSPNRIKSYLENPNFLEDQRHIALVKLQQALDLPKIPERIEGYDISNISGKNATGSMVVLTDGEIDKSQYRRFKIHMSGKPNDVGMHQEMMARRLKHSEWPLPDLIIIDGGLGQVRAASQELSSMNYMTPLFGLAKRMEWLYSSDGKEIRLEKSNPALQLLQRLRDESHRFALSYHRKLRDTIKEKK